MTTQQKTTSPPRGRSGPRSRRTRRAPGRAGIDNEPVLAGVDDALADPHPVSMLALASSTAFALEPSWPAPPSRRGNRPFPTLPAFLEVLAASGRPQHGALAWVLAHLTQDEERRRHVLRTVDPAGLPAWMLELSHTEVYDAWQTLDVMRDGAEVVLGVRLGRFELTAVAALDLDRGVVRDGFALPESLPAFQRRRASRLEAAESESRS